MGIKLVDSEIKVMDVLWKGRHHGKARCRRDEKERYNWNVNTTLHC